MKTSFSRLLLLLLAAGLALYLFLPLNSIKLNDLLVAQPKEIQLGRGETADIDYYLKSELPQTVRFTSSNAKVASVDPRGMVTAISPGEVKIRVQAQNGAQDTVKVVVSGTPAVTLRLSAKNITLNKGQVTGLKAVFNKGADEGTDVEWYSDNPNIARVDNAGRVYGVSGGLTTVHVRTITGLDAQASVYVNVPATAMDIAPDDILIGTDSAMQLGVSFLPEDATDEAVSWQSADPDIVSVDPGGRIYARSEGRTVITAASRGNLRDSIIVTVERGAGMFEIVPHAVTVERGNTILLDPRFTDKAGHEDLSLASHYIRWKSGNEFIATVENGAVRALQSGTTRISAIADGIESICDVTVQTSVKSIALNMEEITVSRSQTGSPIQLEAILTPSDPDDPKVIYTSGNEQVALVSDSGLVTLSGAYGTAVITATASSGAQAQFTVNVVKE